MGIKDLNKGEVSEQAGSAIGDAVIGNLGLNPLESFTLGLAGSAAGRALGNAGLTDLQKMGIGAATLHREPNIVEKFGHGIVNQFPFFGKMATTDAQIQNLHTDFISEMENRGVPGFKTGKVTLSNGKTVEIHADASGIASVQTNRKGEPKYKADGSLKAGKVKTFDSEGRKYNLSDADRELIRDAKDRLGKEARQQVADEYKRHGSKSKPYNDNLRGKIEDYAKESGFELSNAQPSSTIDATQTASMAKQGDFSHMDTAYQTFAQTEGFDPTASDIKLGKTYMTADSGNYFHDAAKGIVPANGLTAAAQTPAVQQVANLSMA